MLISEAREKYGILDLLKGLCEIPAAINKSHDKLMKCYEAVKETGVANKELSNELETYKNYLEQYAQGLPGYERLLKKARETISNEIELKSRGIYYGREQVKMTRQNLKTNIKGNQQVGLLALEFDFFNRKIPDFERQKESLEAKLNSIDGHYDLVSQEKQKLSGMLKEFQKTAEATPASKREKDTIRSHPYGTIGIGLAVGGIATGIAAAVTGGFQASNPPPAAPASGAVSSAPADDDSDDDDQDYHKGKN